MMIQAAGGPGVHPIDFGERRKPIPKWVIGAVAASALLHIAGGAWLYFQRYEATAAAPPTEPPTMTLDLYTPPPPEPKPAPPTTQPPAAQAPIHATPTPTIPTDTLAATPSDVACTSVSRWR